MLSITEITPSVALHRRIKNKKIQGPAAKSNKNTQQAVAKLEKIRE